MASLKRDVRAAPKFSPEERLALTGREVMGKNTGYRSVYTCIHGIERI
jgi:hypothetical protein